MTAAFLVIFGMPVAHFRYFQTPLAAELGVFGNVRLTEVLFHSFFGGFLLRKSVSCILKVTSSVEVDLCGTDENFLNNCGKDLFGSV